MRFGFHFLDFTLPGSPASLAPAIAKTAAAAEAGGASWFTVMDHFFQMEGFQTAHDPMLEGYTTLGFVAAKTERVKLGTVVTGVTYRHPGLLAKIATTLDVLSEGRSFFGLGAAWYEREHLALGVPYPDMSERFERLEEALQIILQMWSDDEGPYNGKHYQLAETISVPQPIQKPAPADRHRGRRREEDPPPGRQVRRRLQPQRHGRRRGRPQAAGAARALRRRGPRLRDDREDHAGRAGEPGRGSRRVPALRRDAGRARHRAHPAPHPDRRSRRVRRTHVRADRRPHGCAGAGEMTTRCAATRPAGS